MLTTDSKFITRNISKLYIAAYKCVDITDIFYYFMLFERTKWHNLRIPGRFIVPEWTWPGRGTFFPIPGLSRAIRDSWSP